MPQEALSAYIFVEHNLLALVLRFTELEFEYQVRIKSYVQRAK
jgi:hypothetical protein